MLRCSFYFIFLYELKFIRHTILLHFVLSIRILYLDIIKKKAFRMTRVEFFEGIDWKCNKFMSNKLDIDTLIYTLKKYNITLSP